MAIKVTDEIIEEMNRLYLEIGTYSGVAKQMGCAPTTVKRYIKQDYSPKVKPKENLTKVESPVILRQVSEISWPPREQFGKLCTLTKDEYEEIVQLWEEM